MSGMRPALTAFVIGLVPWLLLASVIVLGIPATVISWTLALLVIVVIGGGGGNFSTSPVTGPHQ